MKEYSSEHQADRLNNTKDCDPIDWAIIAVMVGGCAVLLSLDQKIEARRKADAVETERKAINGNRLRLNTMSFHLRELESILSRIDEIGTIKIDDTKTGITRGSIVFDSDESQE